jgi:Rrf2 family protein
LQPILNISDAANLAIHAMAHLAHHQDGANHSVLQIAAEQDVSAAHLSKVMRRLTRAGLIRSRRGPGGGFVLGRPADKITLLDIFQAIAGPLPSHRCLFNRKQCLFGGCALGALLSHVSHQVHRFMASRKLSDLTGPPHKHALYLADLGGPPSKPKKPVKKGKTS